LLGRRREIPHRLGDHPGFGAVMRDQRRVFPRGLGIPFRDSSDRGVQAGAARPRHALIRGILDQRVLELARGFRRLAAARRQTRFHQLPRALVQSAVGNVGGRRRQLVRKRPADDRADPRHGLRGRQPAQAGQ